ncbi:MAG: RloB family protein [Panacibacter sp.]
MARNIKIDNSLLKRLKLKEENEKRKTESRIQRERILIVCEGEKTEPNYFKSIEKMLPKGVLHLDILGVGANTGSVVAHAVKENNKYLGTLEEYDQVWVVFDKDDFPDQNFNNAIYLAQKSNIKCAESNEAFELWYVLHFQFLSSAIKRTQYFEILSKIMGAKYEKNNENMYDYLTKHGNEINAITWAEKLDLKTIDQTPSDKKPHTGVYKLIQVLNKFKGD